MTEQQKLEREMYQAIEPLINLVLGIAALAAIIGIPIGVMLGIIKLVKWMWFV